MDGPATLERVAFGDGYEDLSGRHPRTLDDKFRVVLPAGRWRELYAPGGKLTLWVDCLALWTPRSYRVFTAHLVERERNGELPEGKPRVRPFDGHVPPFDRATAAAEPPLAFCQRRRRWGRDPGLNPPVQFEHLDLHVDRRREIGHSPAECAQLGDIPCFNSRGSRPVARCHGWADDSTAADTLRHLIE